MDKKKEEKVTTNRMKKRVFGIIALTLFFIGVSAKAHELIGSSEAHVTEECVIPKLPKIEGERVPFPNANTKFELAAGETYVLNGTLVVQGNKVFLKMDTISQPWLATDKVKASPYYEVASIDVETAKRYEGKMVQVVVTTEKNQPSGFAGAQDLKFSSILPPIVRH